MRISWSNRTGIKRWLESIFSLFGMAILQLAAFIVLARNIGASDYAVIVSVASVVTISVEIVGIGTGDALVRHVSRDRNKYTEAIGTAILAAVLSLPPVALLSIMLAANLGGGADHIAAIVALTTSELVSARSLALSEQIAMAHDRFRLANLCRVIPNLVRISIVLVSCLIFNVDTIDKWWPIQFAFGILISPSFLIISLFIFGKPTFIRAHIFERRNLYFMLTQILRGIQMNVDKVIAGLFFDHQTLANYGVASRLTQYALLPIQAALKILNPTFFREGKHGVLATRRLAYKMVLILTPIATMITAALYFGSPYLQRLLGGEFEFITQMIRANCLLPVLLTVQYLLSDALTGADLANLRVIFLSIAVLLITAASWIGASFGIVGMIFGVLAANIIFIAFLLCTLEFLGRSNRHRA